MQQEDLEPLIELKGKCFSLFDFNATFHFFPI